VSSWEPIRKAAENGRVTPNLANYARGRAEFSWRGARAALDGLPGGRGLNIAYEAVDRHLAHGRGEHVALRWLGKRGEAVDYTYAGLAELTSRFANVLRSLGVGPGERVYVLAGRWMAAWTIWRLPPQRPGSQASRRDD
jgi:acetyl-CoA synthetase